VKHPALRGSARLTAPAPWDWRAEESSCIIRLPETYSVLGWAPFNGGARRATAIVNHQIETGDRFATEHPDAYLRAIIQRLGLKARNSVAMMTGVDIHRTAYASARRGDFLVGAWCTAGCSNALRIGDPASVDPILPGTINVVLAVSQSLLPSAMAEALAMTTEARVLAVCEAGVSSTRSGRPATGTGTDCIVVASPARAPSHRFCGKHTVIGELIGNSAPRACGKALRRRGSQ
jgi:adenosylcobinamide amidohydrolase